MPMRMEDNSTGVTEEHRQVAVRDLTALMNDPERADLLGQAPAWGVCSVQKPPWTSGTGDLGLTQVRVNNVISKIIGSLQEKIFKRRIRMVDKVELSHLARLRNP